VWLAIEGGRDCAGLILLGDDDRVYYRWGARRNASASYANHLLFWTVIEEYAGRKRMLDLGRSNTRNRGLTQFKKQIGGRPEPLPYSFFPREPRHISSEAPGATQRALMQVWRRLRLSATRVIGSALHGHLA